jgi:probable HAF family extracellular repeat protein
MKFRTEMCMIEVCLSTALALPIQLAAQAHPHFKFVDLGALGGPQSSLFGGSRVLNGSGTVAFGGDTSDSDPNYPNYNPLLGQDKFIQHAIQWHKGVKTDLGTLPGGWSSFSGWITDNGFNSGIAETGAIDPVTGWPATDAVVWKNGTIVDMGTLPGGYEAGATAVDKAGQVVGFASNTITDQYSFFGWGTQSRAFRWTAKEGMRDIGDLGGPDAAAWVMNEKGQVAGQSYINAKANSINTLCGNQIPTVDAFLWQRSTGMIDLQGLPGSTCSAANGINNSGQVAGFSYANAISYHAVLWSKGSNGRYKVRDLGDFGTRGGSANWINDAGEVVGYARDKHAFNRAFLWRNGKLKNLGSLNSDTCSAAFGINSKTQVIGNSGACFNFVSRPFLWQSGSIYDLSTAFPLNHFMAAEAGFINEAGEIAGTGTLPNGDLHAYVLIPCKAGTKGCKRVLAGAANPVFVTQPLATEAVHTPSNGRLDTTRVRFGRPYRHWSVGTYQPR